MDNSFIKKPEIILFILSLYLGALGTLLEFNLFCNLNLTAISYSASFFTCLKIIISKHYLENGCKKAFEVIVALQTLFIFVVGLSIESKYRLFQKWKLLFESTKKNAPLDRFSDWAKWSEYRQLSSAKDRKHSIILGRSEQGRPLFIDDGDSLLVVGPTQSGKTTGFILPALLNWEGPAVITSVKNDIVLPTFQKRKSFGSTYIFDPSGETGLDSSSFDPLSLITSFEDAKKLAQLMTENADKTLLSSDSDNSFWYRSASRLLASLLYGAKLGNYAIKDVADWIDSLNFEEPINLAISSNQAQALNGIKAFLAKDEKQQSSILLTLETISVSFYEPCLNGKETAIKFDKLLNCGTLYLCSPLYAQTRYSFILTVLVSLLTEHLYRVTASRGKLNPPMLILLDEAANIAPIPNLAEVASTASALGIQLVSVFQDFSQIKYRYRDHFETIVNNHRAKVILSGVTDLLTLSYVSKLLGDTKTRFSSEARGVNRKKDLSFSETVIPLAPEAALRKLKPGNAILLNRNMNPIIIRLNRLENIKS